MLNASIKLFVKQYWSHCVVQIMHGDSTKKGNKKENTEEDLQGKEDIKINITHCPPIALILVDFSF